VTVPTTDRFSLLFRSPSSLNGFNKAIKLNTQVFVNAANQIVVASPAAVKANIYSTLGQKLYEKILAPSKTTINNAFGAGVYFVQLSVNGQGEIQKVIIR
jgi:hypothetical protein